jgi:hypothetical protein
MDYLFQDGGKPKKTKSKSTKSKTGSKTKSKTATKSKTSTKTGTKTTKSKTGAKKTSSKKGGNFLGAVGDLVAPNGWGPFATAAGLLALDRADAALRRGKSEKSSVKKGGMRGGTPASNKLNEILKEVEFAKKVREDYINYHNKSEVKLNNREKARLTQEISQYNSDIKFLEESLTKDNTEQKRILKGSFLVNTSSM